MKLKKIVLSAVAGACLMAFSSSAFAAPASMPKVHYETVDVGDTLQTAFELKENDFFIGYRDRSDYFDMFKWKNMTGKTVNVTINLTNPYNNRFDFYYGIQSRVTGYIGWQNNQTNEQYKRRELWAVKPYDSVIIKVFDDNYIFDSKRPYYLNLLLSDYIRPI